MLNTKSNGGIIKSFESVVEQKVVNTRFYENSGLFRREVLMIRTRELIPVRTQVPALNS